MIGEKNDQDTIKDTGENAFLFLMFFQTPTVVFYTTEENQMFYFYNYSLLLYFKTIKCFAW